MPGEIPYFIIGTVKLLFVTNRIAYVKVINGNVYTLTPGIPGLEFENLQLEQSVELEVTDRLDRVFSAVILS